MNVVTFCGFSAPYERLGLPIMCLSVPHRNDKATNFKQQATLHGLKK